MSTSIFPRLTYITYQNDLSVVMSVYLYREYKSQQELALPCVLKLEVKLEEDKSFANTNNYIITLW